MKKYIITVSEKFPKTHSRAGDDTGFIEKIKSQVKIHTLRNNYNLWNHRFDQILAREAELHVRTWAGNPYKSKQKEKFVFNVIDNRIGIQKAIKRKDHIEVEGVKVSFEKIAFNDGLLLCDFQEWFKKTKEGDELALIHFTNYRY